MLMVCLSSATVIFAEIHGLPNGYIRGAVVSYNNASSVTVTAGNGVCGDYYWEITQDVTIDLSGVMPQQEGYIYIYIDYSGKPHPAAVIYGSIQVGYWDYFRMGYYDGDDRCIGAVWVNSDGVIPEFTVNSDLEYIYTEPIKQILSNGNPNHQYQMVEATDYLPLNIWSAYVWATNSSASGQVCVIVATLYRTQRRISARGTGAVIASGWIPMENGQKIDLQWYGFNHNDNKFNIYIYGYRFNR